MGFSSSRIILLDVQLCCHTFIRCCNGTIFDKGPSGTGKPEGRSRINDEKDHENIGLYGMGSVCNISYMYMRFFCVFLCGQIMIMTPLLSSAGVSEVNHSSEGAPSENTWIVQLLDDSPRSSIAMKLIGKPTRGLSI